MSGRRKPRDPEAKPTGWTLDDYKKSGALTPSLPDKEWLVRTSDGRQYSVHPFTDEGHDQAQTTASKIGGTIEEYKPIRSTYWNTGEPRYDH